MARPKEFDQAQVLDKAMELFWDRGYEATSLHDLLDHLGIKRQSLYDTFGDKHRLFLAALQRYEDVYVSAQLAILEGPDAGKTAIERIFRDAAQALMSTASQHGCFMVNTAIELAPHDQDSADLVAKKWARTEQAFLYALTRAQAQGELGTQQCDLEALARFLNNSLQGLSVTAKATSNLAALHDIVNVTLSVLG